MLNWTPNHFQDGYENYHQLFHFMVHNNNSYNQTNELSTKSITKNKMVMKVIFNLFTSWSRTNVFLGQNLVQNTWHTHHTNKLRTIISRVDQRKFLIVVNNIVLDATLQVIWIWNENINALY
jgi:hypothetical protein